MQGIKRVAVAMSGGVDSTVAALLLKRSGWRVVGVFMRNWDEREEWGQCGLEEEWGCVRNVCNHLSIPCKQVNFVKEYWNSVFSQFLSEYQAGLTPNPDILCNRRIKFGAFYDHALNNMGVDTMATGHYARVERSECGRTRLLQSVDKFKDQTYFLSQVPQSALQRTLFPIGHLTKAEVRRVAVEAGLEWVIRRKESMGLCFIGKRKFSKFIHEYLEERPGDFISLDGTVIGKHRGHHFFTIGQRAKLGGRANAWFVAGKDPQNNTITVVEGASHPALSCHAFTTSPPHWVTEEVPDPLGWGKPLECLMRYRHQQPLKKCSVEVLEGESTDRGCLRVQCDQPMLAVTPGQQAVFYRGEECLGGAAIIQPAHEPLLWKQRLANQMRINIKSDDSSSHELIGNIAQLEC